jgi:broad specificity phosphatase PhoE
MPGGESMRDLYTRGVHELYRISGENEGRTIAVFTHGTLIRVLMCHIYGYDLSSLKDVPWFENASITKVIYDNGVFHIEYEDRYDHLDPSEATIHNQDWNKGGISDGSL